MQDKDHLQIETEASPFPAPDGFAWRSALLATIETAAEAAGVTPRTIYNWLDLPNPLPAHRREGEAPLIHLGTLMLWIALRTTQSRSFGQHGGER